MTDNKRSEMTGRLYVVGVGPGDPELMTVKASRLLSSVPVIFVPQRDESTPSYARSIIDGLVKVPEQEVNGLIFPMVRDVGKLAVHWERAAETIWQHLRRGIDCAFVNEGDPLFFGTAIHVLEALRKTHPEIDITVIPGISSINASAARATLPLVMNDERMAILSGHCEDRIIRETLESFDTVVFVKVASSFGRLLEMFQDMRLSDKCIYVSKCTTEDERIVRDVTSLRGQELDYLSLLIMRK